MTSDDLRRFADFLAAVNEASTTHGVTIGAYGPADVRVDEDTVMRIAWDEEHSQYVASPETT
ncbi:hypothetical protein O7602_26780 [Micromonospora sp. WMMD1128]|uniref:hypothetical protein n=1 Tax=Micromonospora sp. WMMD1128 TaxID=3015150 RepID=UPI00248D0345|nr:hypothetical protein [Micromonospora sp. WMMD1128]WBB73249.1 hypothetical protein O7602_26780 [Micromonospora sp. WMMD1128]